MLCRNRAWGRGIYHFEGFKHYDRELPGHCGDNPRLKHTGPQPARARSSTRLDISDSEHPDMSFRRIHEAQQMPGTPTPAQNLADSEELRNTLLAISADIARKAASMCKCECHPDGTNAALRQRSGCDRFPKVAEMIRSCCLLHITEPPVIMCEECGEGPAEEKAFQAVPLCVPCRRAAVERRPAPARQRPGKGASPLTSQLQRPGVSAHGRDFSRTGRTADTPGFPKIRTTEHSVNYLQNRPPVAIFIFGENRDSEPSTGFLQNRPPRTLFRCRGKLGFCRGRAFFRESVNRSLLPKSAHGHTLPVSWRTAISRRRPDFQKTHRQATFAKIGS